MVLVFFYDFIYFIPSIQSMEIKKLVQTIPDCVTFRRKVNGSSIKFCLLMYSVGDSNLTTFVESATLYILMLFISSFYIKERDT